MLNLEEQLEYHSRKYEVKRQIENIFANYGFKYIEPIMFEVYDKLLTQGVWNLEESIKVIRPDGKVLIIREDVTTNIVRNMVMNLESAGTTSVFYNAEVFKRKGLRIEVKKQIGIELFAENRKKGDEKILSVAIDILSNFDKEFVIAIGSSEWIEESIKMLDLSARDETRFIKLIANKNSQEIKSFLIENGYTKKIIDYWEKIFKLQGKFRDVIGRARKLELSSRSIEIINYMEGLIDDVSSKSLEDKIQLDLAMVGERNYYDGILIKGYYRKSKSLVLNGGRYDKLTEVCGRADTAIGFCVDQDLIMKTKFERVDKRCKI